VSTPQEHCKRLDRTYGNPWKKFDEFRQPANRRRVGDWPEAAFAPVASAYLITGPIASPTQGLDVSALLACGAWRTTKGIYVYDETLLGQLWQTPLEGALPASLLERLPEWAPYIEVERDVQGIGYVYGVWPVLTCAAVPGSLTAGPLEFRLVCNIGEQVTPVVLLLQEGKTVYEARKAWLDRSREIAERSGGSAQHIANLRSEGVIAADVDGLLNLVLYLCAENADLARQGQSDRPSRPTPAKTRRGERLFPPHEPRKREVGWRLGAALRSAQGGTEGDGGGGERHGPRPHVRRAHWHTFLTGPRTGEQKRILRWLPPIPVNVEGVDDLVPTVRRIDV